MNTKIFFERKAVSCLLPQGDLQSPLRTLAMRTANAARFRTVWKVRSNAKVMLKPDTWNLE